ncbi:unnamed protein product [Victoria cruziana]
MRPGCMRNGYLPVRRSARGVVRCRPQRWLKPVRLIPLVERCRCGRGMWCAPFRRTACSTCVPVAPASGLPIRPVLKHGPRSLTCVRVNRCGNLEGARKLSGRIPLRVALPTDLDLLRRVRVGACLSGPERW